MPAFADPWDAAAPGVAVPGLPDALLEFAALPLLSAPEILTSCPTWSPSREPSPASMYTCPDLVVRLYCPGVPLRHPSMVWLDPACGVEPVWAAAAPGCVPALPAEGLVC